MVELADTPDLGSGGNPVQVQVLLPAPAKSLDFKPKIRLFSFACTTLCTTLLFLHL
jgi:hypothetical protein